MKRKIWINVGYDGSAPNTMEGVKQEKKNVFTIFPSWGKEKGIGEEAKGKGLRLGFEVVNESNQTQEVILNIDWEDEERTRMKFRDFVFIKREEDTEWQMVPSFIKGSYSIVKLNLTSGKTLVYLNPKYNYSDNERFVEKVSKNKLVEKEKVGESEENRNIWLLKIGEGKTKVFIMARNHAYESAGNYCVEGMVEWLLSEDSLSKYFLTNFVFYFLPMTNPDGVYNGLSRLTSLQGADLNRVITKPDKAHWTIKKTLDEIQPHLFINLHNWMDKFKDGLLCRRGKFARKIKFYMPDQIEYGKKWYIEDEEVIFQKRDISICPKLEKSWKNYCEENFGSIGLVFEFPWFGRNTKIMKETGVKALKSCLFAWMELMNQ